MARLLLALDQGTTSSRAILFDEAATQLAAAQREYPQLYPRPGWVEHNPDDIWQTQLATAREVLQGANVQAADIAAIGITNQRETTILWDRATGRPLHNAIVWQDRRTADFCSGLHRAGHAPMIQRKTGLVPDAYFSASKLRWLLEHVPGARERAAAGELAFGTVDAWLLYNLTSAPGSGGDAHAAESAVHATDVSNASRTMLFNIHTCQWDDELLGLFDIPRAVLPEVKNSAGFFGTTMLFGNRPIPITGMAGDQQAALFGQACLTPGLAKNTYGTGCFALMNMGNIPALSKHQLLTTIAWRLPASDAAAAKIEKARSEINDSVTYALEGSVFVGGAVVQWLRDGLGIIQSAAEIEPLAASVPDSGGVYLVPAFAGLGAPYWDQYARGSISGLTRGTTRAHLARAALESIAFQVADLLDVMHADAATPIRELRVDGGGARNALLLQFQADLLQMPVLRPKVTETTALGAALLAGLGSGLYQSPEEVLPLWKPEAEFRPKLSADQIARRRARWSAALARSRDWEEKS